MIFHVSCISFVLTVVAIVNTNVYPGRPNKEWSYSRMIHAKDSLLPMGKVWSFPAIIWIPIHQQVIIESNIQVSAFSAQ